MTNSQKFNDAAAGWIARMDAAGTPVVKCNGVLYYYRDGIWRPGIEQSDQAEAWLNEEANANKIALGEKKKAVWATVGYLATPKEPVKMDANRLIVCRNGTLNTESGDLDEHDPLNYCTRFVDIEYNPDAECPEWLAALERSLEGHAEVEKTIALLQEFFGVSIVGKGTLPRPLRQALVLWGPSNTGKSSVSNVLKAMFPLNRVCNVTVGAALKSFGLEPFLGALAWIAEEAIDARSSGGAELLKRLFNAEDITVARKYLPSVSTVFDGAVLFSSNKELEVNDDSDGVYKRLTAIRFDKVFTDKDARKLKGGKLETHLEHHNEYPGILNWALEGAVRAIERGHYDVPKTSKTVGQAWRARSSPPVDFLMTCTEYDENVYNTSRVVAVAASVFAKKEHDIRKSPSSCGKVIPNEVRTIHPQVKVGEQVSIGAGARSRTLGGLKLNDLGLEWVRQAKEEGAFNLGEIVKTNLKWL